MKVDFKPLTAEQRKALAEQLDYSGWDVVVDQVYEDGFWMGVETALQRVRWSTEPQGETGDDRV